MVHIQLTMKLAETSLSHGTIERIIHDCLKMKKVTSGWAPHQLTHEQRVKLCRENLAKFQSVSCRLCDIITGGETIGRLITNERTQASLANVNHQLLQFVEAKNFFSIFFKSNGPVLIYCVDEGKIIDHNYSIENSLRLLSRKYGNKEDHQVQKL